MVFNWFLGVEIKNTHIGLDIINTFKMIQREFHKNNIVWLYIIINVLIQNSKVVHHYYNGDILKSSVSCKILKSYLLKNNIKYVTNFCNKTLEHNQ